MHSETEEYRAFRTIVGETAGLPDADAFRSALFEQVHRLYPEVVVSGLCQRLNGAARFVVSRFIDEAGCLERFPTSVREHLGWLDDPRMPPVAVATAFVPAAIRRETETFTSVWKYMGVNESIATPVGDDESARGFLLVGLEESRRASVEPLRSLLLSLRPYVGRSLQGFAYADRLRAAVARPPAIVTGLPLRPREVEVAALAAEGRLNKEIAHLLGISVPTVKNHLQAIFAKTGARNRTELARMLLGRGTPPG